MFVVGNGYRLLVLLAALVLGWWVWIGVGGAAGRGFQTSCWVLKEQPGPRLVGFPAGGGCLPLWRGCCFWPVPSSTKLRSGHGCVRGMRVVGVGGGWRVV